MTTPTLPPLRDDRVDAIESAVFARIADERVTRRRRRRGVWTGIGAAAAVLVVAAVIGPALSTPTGTSGSSISGVSEAGGAVDPGLGVDAPDEGLRDVSGQALPEMSAGGAADSSTATPAGRDIIATGSSTIEVDDVRAAIDRVSDAAAAAGGYVESSQVGGGGGVVPLDGAAPESTTVSSGWITVRVPADALASVMDGLSEVGEVTATSVTRSDVTEQTVDLRARVAAGEASVARLTELMTQAGSVADLIAAESALAERQAQLDSDRQVLQSLESQVAMSSLSVQLNVRSETVVADPAGFGDGLVAGWNGLIATLNGVVIGLGFLLPWIAVAGVLLLIVWGVRRIVRARRGAHEA
ncbi:DUF4349 domain-containing protein [Microbacterium sp. ACRRU]|uniref:DUF4349 domain-containing protein n=1 Tax=Microbacterium TaxID=33882 RepID=UPI001EF53426|nr:DUF4349 domain-containing protein [Microbacterium sp. ACRRU]MCG7416153.1 DUF4349 domain-containing protein [Microbacterium sp. ACRRU]